MTSVYLVAEAVGAWRRRRPAPLPLQPPSPLPSAGVPHFPLQFVAAALRTTSFAPGSMAPLPPAFPMWALLGRSLEKSFAPPPPSS